MSPPSPLRTHYDTLRVSRHAPEEVIKAAYRALCLKYHPDQNPDSAEAERVMRDLNASYEALCDPIRRRMHDEWIEGQEEQKHRQAQERSSYGSVSPQVPRPNPPAASQPPPSPPPARPVAGRSPFDSVPRASGDMGGVGGGFSGGKGGWNGGGWAANPWLRRLAGPAFGLLAAGVILKATETRKQGSARPRTTAALVNLPPPAPVPEGLAARGEQERQEKGPTRQIAWPDGTSMTFSWCPSGAFHQGSPPAEEGREDHEPWNLVPISRGFWMAVTECSRDQWRAVLPDWNPPESLGPRTAGPPALPVEFVNWEDVQAFVAAVNRLAILPSGWVAAIPTESQWEYACRAGTSTPFHFGGVLDGTQANCDGNQPFGTRFAARSRREPTPLGTFAPNPWGFHDFHGNVMEWCAASPPDGHGAKSNSGDAAASTGVDPADAAVLRGGSYLHRASRCRSASRLLIPPELRRAGAGFRLALVQP